MDGTASFLNIVALCHGFLVPQDLRLTNSEYLTPSPFPYHLVLNHFKLTDHCSSNLALLIENKVSVMQAHQVLDQLHGYKTCRLKAWEWNSGLHSIWEPPSQQWWWSPSSSSKWCIDVMIQFHSHLESSPASAEILSHKIFWFVIVSGGCLFLQQQNYWGPQCNQGPIVAFNLKQADGSWVSYHEVEKLAALSNIQLRVSCFSRCYQ